MSLYSTDRKILETAVTWLEQGADIIASVYKLQRGRPEEHKPTIYTANNMDINTNG